MEKWFYNPENQFFMWEMTHLITIALVLICIVGLFIFQDMLRPYRKGIRLIVGWTLLVSRLSLDFWYVYTNEWYVSSSLPFELCSIASIVSAIMLLTKSKFLFEIFYFIAIGGAIQAILTPELLFGFPQYRYFHFFLDHSLLILAPLIMISLYKYRITFRSLIKSFLALNMIAALVYGINVLIDANYMFLMHKPSTASIIDYLGPYPYYIISLEVVAFLIFVILYLPFLSRKGNRSVKERY